MLTISLLSIYLWCVVRDANGLNTWFGTAPFCMGSSYDCNAFNMDEVKYDSKGNGYSCVFGEKLNCEVRGKQRLEIASDPNQLIVMAYNIKEMPWISGQHGQVERSCQIPQAIAEQFPKVEVLLLQEVFLNGCTPEMDYHELLPYFGWRYVTDILGKNYPINGGIMIASAHPLLDIEYHVFRSKVYRQLDSFSSKGFVYVKIQKADKMIHFVSLHMQSFNGKEETEARIEQTKQIREFLTSKRIPSNEVVIMGGDFNVDKILFPNVLTKIETILRAKDVENVGKIQTTYDFLQNTIPGMAEVPEYLDYIMYATDHLTPKKANLEVVKLTSAKPFSFCYWAPFSTGWVSVNSLECFDKREIVDLSDHFPIIGNFTF